MPSRRAVALFSLAACAMRFVLVSAADADRWWAHVKFLAYYSLQCRDTGSAGYRKAADYVAGEFQKAGLAPGGLKGYLLPVRFRSRTVTSVQFTITGVAPTTRNIGLAELQAYATDPASRG